MKCLKCGKLVTKAGRWKEWNWCRSCGFRWVIDKEEEGMLYMDSNMDWQNVPDGCLAVFKESEL